jgi:hypothetical protein
LAQQLVNLDDDFSASIPRAQLEIFLLLADAIRPSLSDLYRVLPDGWHEVITILARILAQVLPAMKTASQVQPIWRQFLADARIVSLPKKATVILTTASARLAAIRRNRKRNLQYVDQANDEAVNWIRTLGISRNVSRFAQIAKVPLRVYFDPAAEQYCASSSSLAGEIGWKLQLIEYALYGALIPDLLFEHEYISHLLPRNQSLSQPVRERWLTVALESAHQNSAGNPNQRHVNLYLWGRYRDELSQHKGGGGRAYGPYALEARASNAAFHNPQIFWLLTSAFLELGDDDQSALWVDYVLARITELNDAQLRTVLSSPWTDLDHFVRLIESAK